MRFAGADISQFFGMLAKMVCLTPESVAGWLAAAPPPAPAPRVAKLEIGWSEISAASSVYAFSLLKAPQAFGAA
jgi:hypothetical protein